MPYEFTPHINTPHSRALASLRSSGIRSLEQIRALSPLPEDAGREIDDAIGRVGRQRLPFVSALIDAGLVKPMPNWLQILRLAFDNVNDVGAAKQTMEFDVQYDRALQDIKRQGIPIYGTWEAFSFGSRFLSVAEGANYPVETNRAEQATRNVNYTIEYQGINGLPFNIDGETAPGILTSPAITYDYVGNKSLLVQTGEELKTTVLGMVDKAIAKNRFGPFAWVIGTGPSNRLNDDYKTGSNTATTTIRQRLSEMTYEQRPLQIVTADLMPAEYTALIQMTSDVIDVVVGQGPQNYSWETNNGPFSSVESMVLACEIVRVHQDYNGDTGIVVGHTGI